MSIEDSNLEEITVTLKLKSNILEVAKILSICYSFYGDKSEDMLQNFFNEPLEAVICSLASAPIEPPTFPESLKDLLRRKVNQESDSDSTLDDLK